MATKPTVDPQWDSNGTNLSAITAGHKTDGYANGFVPTAGELNTWMQLVYLWILWFKLNIATINRTKLQSSFSNSGWVATAGGFAPFTIGGGASYCWVWTTTTGGNALMVTSALDLPDGYKLTSYSFTLGATTASPTGNFQITIQKIIQPAGTPVVLAAFSVANGSFPTTATKFTMNFAAVGALSAQTVTVNAAGGTYTRSAGSFLTDGFFVGQLVQWSGFSNGGNNAQKTITTLTATVMTVSTTGLVNETGGVGSAAVSAVSPALDGTFTLHATYTMASTTAGFGVGIGGEQYTGVPQ